MTKQITLEEVLKLVSFEHGDALGWRVRSVFGHIYGNVNGDIYGAVSGDINGDIYGAVGGDVYETIYGKINHRRWKFIETPKEKLERLIGGASEEELLKLINQLENNND
jgi:hypothetical protein